MSYEIASTFAEEISGFKLPAYDEIPDVGLYLEQTVKYIDGYLALLPDTELTASMVSNYVKKGLLSNPVKKQYSREQIAELFYIAVTKTSFSIDEIHLMLKLQQATYSTKTAYEYFRLEFMNVLHYVFGIKDKLDNIGVDNTEQKFLLRNSIITIAHKIYLERYLKAICELLSD